jgi:hypothetical protein
VQSGSKIQLQGFAKLGRGAESFKGQDVESPGNSELPRSTVGTLLRGDLMPRALSFKATEQLW